MSDDESMTDNSLPPALEDADLDDVSSGASVVSDSSASVSIATDDEVSSDESEYSDELPAQNDGTSGGGLGEAFVVPLKTGSDEEVEESPETGTRMRRRRSSAERRSALDRNSLRRQASNDMLAAMRAAAAPVSMEDGEEARHDHAPRRRPPPRTKSGAVTEGAEIVSGDEPRRRPPPRTKSGEGMVPGAASPPQRRAPPRTKSGEGLLLRESSGHGNLGDSQINFDMSMNIIEGQELDLDADADDMLTSPNSLRRSRHNREEALSRNAVRRQASSDMLRAMRDSASRTPSSRAAPSRAKSSGASLQRRPPPRTASGECLTAPPLADDGEESTSPERRRRPPPRTKSGEGLLDGKETTPRRRPPSRTVSGGVFAPPIPTIEE